MILLLYLLCLFTGGEASTTVTGHSGGGVLILCKYKAKYVTNAKYFCRGQSGSECNDQIKTENKNKWINNSRFSLYDNTSASEFYVMIRKLTEQDSGIYWCAVDIGWQKDTYTQVRLEVKEVSISKTGYLGGALNISYNYPSTYTDYPKFLCKIRNNGCAYNTAVNESRKIFKKGTISLYDDREKKVFSATLINLTQQDAGEYWCGAEINWDSGHVYKVYVTQIQLRVTEQQSIKTSSTSSSSSSSSASSLTTAQKSSRATLSPAVPKSPPKMNIATGLTPPVSPASTHPPSQTMRTTTSSKHETTSTFSPATGPTVVAVCVSVLLIVFGILIVALRKKKLLQASVPTQAINDSSNDHTAPPADVDYDEIKDISLHLNSSTVYCTVQRPTVSSDPCQSVNYTAHLPTNHRGSSHVYTTVEQSEVSPDQDIYSEAQLPTSWSDPSVVVQESDLNYTNVSFNKNVAKNVGKETATKEDNSCDYDTVKTVTGSY